jgi:VanZ family protein
LKATIFRIITMFFLVLTFISIFNFSNQDGQTSGGLSRKVARKIVDVFPYTKNLKEETKNKIVEKTQPIIRKGAHLSIYTLVGIFIMSYISTYKIHLKYKFLISILVGLIYASSDEIHQSFIPGRTASIIDVGIDTSGVLLGIILVLIIISVYKALTKKSYKNKINKNLN